MSELHNLPLTHSQEACPELAPHSTSFYEENSNPSHEACNSPRLRPNSPQSGQSISLLQLQAQAMTGDLLQGSMVGESKPDKHQYLDTQTNVSETGYETEENGGRPREALQSEAVHMPFEEKIVEENLSEDSEQTQRDDLPNAEPPVFYGPLNIDDLSTEASFNNNDQAELPNGDNNVMPWEEDFFEPIQQPEQPLLDESTRATLNASTESENSAGGIFRQAGGPFRVSLRRYNEIVVVTAADRLGYAHMSEAALLDLACLHLGRVGDYLMEQTRVGLRRGQRKELMVALDVTKGASSVRVWGKMANVATLFERARENRRKNCLVEYVTCRERVAGLYLLLEQAPFNPSLVRLLDRYERRQLVIEGDFSDEPVIV